MRGLLANRAVVLALGLGALVAVGYNLMPLFFDPTQVTAEREEDADLLESLLFDHEVEPQIVVLPEPTRGADIQTLSALGPSHRDPFRLHVPHDDDPRPVPSEIVGLGEGAEPPLTVDTQAVPAITAVAVSSTHRAASIGGHVVRVGHEVAGWIVQAIESQSAVVQRGDRWARIWVTGPNRAWEENLPHELNGDMRWESGSPPAPSSHEAQSHEETAALEPPAAASSELPPPSRPTGSG